MAAAIVSPRLLARLWCFYSIIIWGQHAYCSHHVVLCTSNWACCVHNLNMTILIELVVLAHLWDNLIIIKKLMEANGPHRNACPPKVNFDLFSNFLYLCVFLELGLPFPMIYVSINNKHRNLFYMQHTHHHRDWVWMVDLKNIFFYYS